MKILTNLDQMPYRSRSRGMNLRPVNRIKHVVDKQAGVALGVTDITNLINTFDNPTLAGSSDVMTGSKVHGFYLKVEVSATSGTALANVYMYIWKNPGGNLVSPAANAVGVSDNKKYVIHQEMIMLQKFDADVAANPRVLFNGVVRIPRGYQRNGPNDIIQLVVLPPGGNIDLCIQCHYKEFR